MGSKAEAVMPQKRKGPRGRGPADAPRRRASDRDLQGLKSDVLGIIVMAAALCLMLALASFHPEDMSISGPAAETGRTFNLIGPVGASIANLVLMLFGAAAFLLPLTLALPGICFVTGRRLDVRPSGIVGYFVFFVACAMTAHLWMEGHRIFDHQPGGLVGAHGAEILRALFGGIGAYILVYAIMALSFVVTTRISIIGLFGRATRSTAREVKKGATALRERANGSDKREAPQQPKSPKPKSPKPEAAVTPTPIGEPAPLPKIHGVEPVMATSSVVERRGGIRRLLAKLAGADKMASRRSAKFSLWEIPQDHEGAVDDAPYTLGGGRPSSGAPVLDAEEAGAQLEDALDREALGSDGDTVMTQAEDSLEAPVLDAEDAGAELEDPLDREALESDGDTVMGPRVTSGRRPVLNKKRRKEIPAEQIEIPLPETAAITNYKVPPLHFLDFDQDDQVEVNPSFLQGQARRLVEVLRTFRIDGRVTEIHPGPVVTMYEFEPAPGVRISRIAGLSDDLAMALKAVKVRIVAPIPGKGVVGFEVPNKTREMVFLKEIIGSKAFLQKKMSLPLALGKDIHGEPMMADLSRMPHLLVAGTTGSGKSVGVNSMITSLLYRHSPEDVRFIMVDPKMLELSIYEGIPHLLLPVVTDSKKAALALRWAVHEMDRRYEVMMNAGVRDLRTYNRKAEAAQARRDKAKKKKKSRAKPDAETEMLPAVDTDRLKDVPQKMPYIVVVIDEFADLMMVAGKEVEYCVARIAQKARAAGIHLILATQRPSTDVITGVIKANFPTRIAFQVSSSIDSRTILSTNGAENLLGMGDMLFMPPGSSRLTRVHGAFISEDEIRKVVAFIAAQGEPEYLNESVLIPEEERGGDGDAQDNMDPMYEEAIRIVGRDGRASTSHLQRRLSLGYNRAARIIDQLERDGLVGPGRGAKPREVDRAAINELIARWDQT